MVESPAARWRKYDYQDREVGEALFAKVKAVCSDKTLDMEFLVPHALTADITSLLKGARCSLSLSQKQKNTVMSIAENSNNLRREIQYGRKLCTT